MPFRALTAFSAHAGQSRYADGPARSVPRPPGDSDADGAGTLAETLRSLCRDLEVPTHLSAQIYA